MAAKPTSVPTWATAPGPSSGITEPSSGQKANGWDVDQKPPAQHFNWFWNLVCQWLAYLDGLTADAVTWTAKHIFTVAIRLPRLFGSTVAGIILDREGTLDNVSSYFDFGLRTSRVGLWKANSASGSNNVLRTYSGATLDLAGANTNSQYEITLNAFWDVATSKWLADNFAGGDSYIIRMGSAGIIWMRKTNIALGQTDAVMLATAPTNDTVIRIPDPTFHRVGSGGSEPAFSNSWAPYDPDGGGPLSMKPVFWKDSTGMVHIKGKAFHAAGAIAGATIFTLPIGYRPAYSLNYIPCPSLGLNTAAGNRIPVCLQILGSDTGSPGAVQGVFDDAGGAGSVGTVLVEFHVSFHPSTPTN